MGAQVVEIVSIHFHLTAADQIHAALGAVVDFVVQNVQIPAGFSQNADGAAAEEAGGGDGGIAAAVEIQHTAAAFTGGFGVPQGQILYSHICAAGKGKHVGISGDGGNQVCILSVFATDGQIIHTGNIQLLTVIGVVPAVILACVHLTIIGGSAQVQLLRIDDDVLVGANGS